MARTATCLPIQYNVIKNLGDKVVTLKNIYAEHGKTTNYRFIRTKLENGA